jgi:hypothetical protein
MEYEITDANIELDEYQILCLINHENLTEFVDIIKKELDQWNTIEITIPIRRLVCMID